MPSLERRFLFGMPLWKDAFWSPLSSTFIFPLRRCSLVNAERSNVDQFASPLYSPSIEWLLAFNRSTYRLAHLTFGCAVLLQCLHIGSVKVTYENPFAVLCLAAEIVWFLSIYRFWILPDSASFWLPLPIIESSLFACPREFFSAVLTSMFLHITLW